ncbi:ABC transporter permease [Magnetospirillum molischianum]|uniref:Permease protein of ABC transporter n=1 Tax=Magnetospirillum molischianum DSM 120 TaxID=1150626 RepID=H8FWQ6_MAGML|nr:FtsX-like permease family protein [Magnetospirillum molischianum]CCG42794.1 Permease protein of ABC transporter [Magnetospirillum molischianum DSM 120]
MTVAPRIRSTLFTAMGLAWRDLLHEWRITACLVLALAAVLTPLLVLFGLKMGVITTMSERLLRDPHNLEVLLVGSGRLEPAWFEALQARPEVGFLVPRTRSLSATLDLMAGGGMALTAVEMIPTANGDPLLGPKLPPLFGPGSVLLSQSAAQSLGVVAGGHVTAVVARTVKGERQVARFVLTVAGVVPESAFGRDGVFVLNPLLVATEDFRDGFAAPLLGASENDPPPPTGPRSYASARLFAKGLDDVGPLADRLRAQGMEVRTHAAEIETVKSIDRVLGFIFGVIAAISVIGYGLSLSASLWANVDRKRKDLALIRLIGFSRGAVMAFPATQALLVALIGCALSLMAYWGVSLLFNHALSSNLADNEFVCRLPQLYAVIAVVATAVLVLAASTIGAYRASLIDPAESLRDL